MTSAATRPAPMLGERGRKLRQVDQDKATGLKREESSFGKEDKMASQTLSTGEHIRKVCRDSRSNRELREANRNLHDFLDLLGHELRSPLAAIRNALHVLDLKGNDVLLQERVRGMMDRQIQCITRLVQDMQDISMIEHGRLRYAKNTWIWLKPWPARSRLYAPQSRSAGTSWW